jgi:arginine N-succinyltransferase
MHQNNDPSMNADRRRRWLLRPVQPDDLQALLAMAAASPDGLHSLPEDEAKMRARIEASVRSFESPDDASGEETYLFVLEDRLVNRLRGCSGIAARAGFSDRFYTYRNEFVVHANAELGVWRRMHTLNLCHDLAPPHY